MVDIVRYIAEDWGKCPICNKLFFNPLCLLDCLHVFCELCVQGEFEQQVKHSHDPRKRPQACPGCGKSVNVAYPDHFVHTVVEKQRENFSNKQQTQKKETKFDKKKPPSSKWYTKILNE